MVLPHLSYLGRVRSFVSLVAVIFGVVYVIVWFVRSIRRDPHDRVLRFEALAFAKLFPGSLLLKAFGFWWPLDLIWLILFFGFTGVAAYYGISTWLGRRRQPRA
jgi:uncharacterized membrane protein (DUF485 family)